VLPSLFLCVVLRSPLLFMLRPFRMTDRPSEIFDLLHDWQSAGYRCALVLLVEIIGGAARALGAPMIVREDGLYCGFVSGGCVEAAVAREGLEALEDGTDRQCRFGQGSPYLDIVLPCGGGIVLAVHVLRDGAVIGRVRSALAAGLPAALSYSPLDQRLELASGELASGWQADRFIARYQPDPRLFLSARGLEGEMLTALAQAAGLEVIAATAEAVRDQAGQNAAVVMLHHDLEVEEPILRAALASPAFYIGCLGSRRTHDRRLHRLRAEGYPPEHLERLHAPIGLFGPTRTARALAVSVLAEILAEPTARGA